MTALWDAPDLTQITGGGAIFDGIVFNSDPSLSKYSDSSGAELGLFYAAQAHPWIRQVSNNFVMRDSAVGSGLVGQHVIIEGYDSGNDTTTLQFVVERCPSFASPNLRYVGKNNNSYIPGGIGYDNSLTSLGNFGSKAFGFGEWDRSYWGPNINAAKPDTLSYAVRAGGTGTTKYHGYTPAPGQMQRLTATDVAAIAAATAPGSQQVICSRSMCVVEQLGNQTYSHVKDSAGDGFSYYATLSVDWSYRGQTHVLSIFGGTHAAWLFPGLEIGLNYGSGVVWYIVTGTYPALGYITVYRESTTASVLAGNMSVTYTGTTISQRTASLIKFGAVVTP